MPSRALISALTATTDHDLRNDHLKLCFLWYDEIILECIGNYNETAFIRSILGLECDSRSTVHGMSDVIRPLDSRVKDQITGGFLAEASKGYPRWGPNYANYTYPEPQTSAEFAHNVLLAKIAEEHGLPNFVNGYDIEQAEGRARAAVDAVELWERLNVEMPCMLQANSDERTAMVAAHQFGAIAQADDTPVRLLEATIPSLRNVSWSAVVKLRKNSAFDSLRRQISTAAESAGGDFEKAKRSFSTLAVETTELVLDGARPRPKRVAFEAFLANLPGFTFNPFSLFLGARDAIRHREAQLKFDAGERVRTSITNAEAKLCVAADGINMKWMRRAFSIYAHTVTVAPAC